MGSRTLRGLRFLVKLAVLLILLCASFEQPSFAATEHDMSFVIVRSSIADCEPNCPQWIEAQGKIVAATAGKLAKLLTSPTNRNLPILLNSYGGDIRAAMLMGRMIRRYHMSTGIGMTNFVFCDPFEVAKCRPTVSNNTYRGRAREFPANCFSACPLILMGGETRVFGPLTQLGLHQPISTSHPYIDRYWETYRMIHGRKVVLSKKFIKRIQLPTKTSVGVTPFLRKELVAYIGEMKASLKIIDEMQKASPKDMHMEDQDTARSLGLATGAATLKFYDSEFTCLRKSSPRNCVTIK